MDRRHFLAATLALGVAARGRAAAGPAPVRTRWRVIGSEGFDAIAFLGSLTGRALYRKAYAADADAFAAKLPAAIVADIPRLADEADASPFGLLWPVLANMLSGADITTLDSVIAALSDLDGRVRKAFLADPAREEADFTWLHTNASRLVRIFEAFRDAGFPAFRRKKLGSAFDARVAEVGRSLARYDVVCWHEKLTGRSFDPVITVVLLAFSKPHGAKMQGQCFLQAVDYDIATTVRIAAHEMLHPPVPLQGAAALAALQVLGRDPLIARIVREHDPALGYTTLDGLLNEDLAQALDQIISEALGVARHAAERWRTADQGMHVLAAGLYAMLRQDAWAMTGGDLEEWLARATATGRLAPDKLHAAAARVLGRPIEQLWPVQG